MLLNKSISHTHTLAHLHACTRNKVTVDRAKDSVYPFFFSFMLPKNDLYLLYTLSSLGAVKREWTAMDKIKMHHEVIEKEMKKENKKA